MFISGPRKECVNITIEHVENGAWTCCASAWDDMTGVIDSKTCVQQKLSCIGVRQMPCDLVCLDDPRNPHGILGKWYYEVNKNNKTWMKSLLIMSLQFNKALEVKFDETGTHVVDLPVDKCRCPPPPPPQDCCVFRKVGNLVIKCNKQTVKLYQNLCKCRVAECFPL